MKLVKQIVAEKNPDDFKIKADFLESIKANEQLCVFILTADSLTIKNSFKDYIVDYDRKVINFKTKIPKDSKILVCCYDVCNDAFTKIFGEQGIGENAAQRIAKKLTALSGVNPVDFKSKICIAEGQSEQTYASDELLVDEVLEAKNINASVALSAPSIRNTSSDVNINFIEGIKFSFGKQICFSTYDEDAQSVGNKFSDTENLFAAEPDIKARCIEISEICGKKDQDGNDGTIDIFGTLNASEILSNNLEVEEDIKARCIEISEICGKKDQDGNDGTIDIFGTLNASEILSNNLEVEEDLSVCGNANIEGHLSVGSISAENIYSEIVSTTNGEFDSISSKIGENIDFNSKTSFKEGVKVDTISSNEEDSVSIEGSISINNEGSSEAALSIKPGETKRVIECFFDDDNNHYEGYKNGGGVYDIYRDIDVASAPKEGMYVAKLEEIDGRKAFVFSIKEEFLQPSNVFALVDGEDIVGDELLTYSGLTEGENNSYGLIIKSDCFVSQGNKVTGLTYDLVEKRRVAESYKSFKASECDGDVKLDLSYKDVFTIELDDNVSISFDNIPEEDSSQSIFVKIFVKTTETEDAYTVSWSEDILWENGTPTRINSSLKNVTYFVAGKASRGVIRLWNNGDVAPNISDFLVLSGSLIPSCLISYDAGLRNFINCVAPSVFIEGNTISGAIYNAVRKKRVSSMINNEVSDEILINPSKTSSIRVVLDANKSFSSETSELQEGLVYFVSLILIGDGNPRQISFDENILFAESENLKISVEDGDKNYIVLKYRKIEADVQVLFSKF